MHVRWIVCILPPIVVILVEETPGLNGLDGINASGLTVMNPLLLALSFAITAAIIGLARWLFHRFELRSRVSFIILTMVIVGLLSPIAYLDGDWVLLGAIEFASLPAAFLLASRARSLEESG